MTSTTATPGRSLPGWLKFGLLAAGVFVLCWAGAIAWWRGSHSEPGAADLALALLALPLGLVLAGWGIGKFAATRPAAAQPAAPTQAAQAASAAPMAPPLAILASALRSPYGASTEELAAAIAEERARPDLDSELVDDDGFPVNSARSLDAVDETLQEEINEWLALNGLTELHFSEVQWRALTLGTAVARELAAQAASELLPIDGPAPTLRLASLLPPAWTAWQRGAAIKWFQHTLAQFGWPAAAIVAADLPPASGEAAAALFSRLVQDSHTGNAHSVSLVIACDSQIDQDIVDEWAAKGSLLTPRRQQGRVPGEGAAGLLLTSLHTAQGIDGAMFAQLHPMLEGRRDASLDEVKRVEPKVMAELVQGAVQAAGLDLSQVAVIAADTDGRSNRTQELMGLASSALPQLDGSSDVARLGAALGSCGAVPALCALALAHHHALTGAPALFVSNDDPDTCRVALVCPPSAGAAA